MGLILYQLEFKIMQKLGPHLDVFRWSENICYRILFFFEKTFSGRFNYVDC